MPRPPTANSPPSAFPVSHFPLFACLAFTSSPCCSLASPLLQLVSKIALCLAACLQAVHAACSAAGLTYRLHMHSALFVPAVLSAMSTRWHCRLCNLHKIHSTLLLCSSPFLPVAPHPRPIVICCWCNATQLPSFKMFLDSPGDTAVEGGAWQEIPLGLDPRVVDLLGNSVALNTTASVKQEQDSGQHLSSRLTPAACLEKKRQNKRRLRRWAIITGASACKQRQPGAMNTKGYPCRLPMHVTMLVKTSVAAHVFQCCVCIHCNVQTGIACSLAYCFTQGHVVVVCLHAP